MNRREFLQGVSGSLVLGGAGQVLPRTAMAASFSTGQAGLPSGTLASSLLVHCRAKKPLIKRTYRAPKPGTAVMASARWRCPSTKAAAGGRPLGQDVGRFSWRQWSYRFTPMRRGKGSVMARASNRIGQTQTAELILNPAGNHHNLIQKVNFQVI